jgi:predicted alpha/beta superfamily hydrolase
LDYDNDIGVSLIVGVGWEGDPAVITTTRRHEFTPVDAVGDGTEGGASQFTEYMRERVLPGAEAHLGVAPGYRMVVASEKGALWALADLFGADPTFDRYLLVSPDVSWNDEYAMQLEAERAAAGEDLAARLRVYTGANEPAERREAMKRFLNQLRARNYPGLSIEHTEIPDAGYGVAKVIGYHKGLRLMSR